MLATDPPSPPTEPADARLALQRLIETRSEDYASLSRMLGRNAAYIQQFIKRGTPRRLSESDRHRLAAYFGVSEAMLGAPARSVEPPAAMALVPLIDVRASAGPGAHADSEGRGTAIGFDRKWLRDLAKGSIDGLSIIRVSGDSMLPTLTDGDDIIVDTNDGADRLRDGIYVLRLDDMLMVKRLAREPAGRGITIRSDNPAYPSWQACDPARIGVVGRVLWHGRKLG